MVSGQWSVVREEVMTDTVGIIGPDVERRGGTVMIEVENAAEMVGRLAERKVFVDCRPGVGVRMSPHFFNTDEEVEEALGVLGELME